ncbi:MAG: hypothetical protein FWG31_04610 [Oscillospiraceae bacterium]|nr:hypothetical protein [Oscillospiraceae bacterium]
MSVVGNLLGNIESAYVTVHDFRAAGTMPDLSVANIAHALDGKPPLPDLKGAVKKNFRVQFNPSEIQLNTATEQYSKMDAQNKALVDKNVIPSAAELTTALYFDHMVVADSFMMDKPMLGLSVSSVTNIAMSVLGGVKDHSVQKEVEGFIAAIQNPLTRTVTFHWTDFTFTGSLSSVDAQYTMFSNLGRPVRAKVTIRIRQQMSKSTLDCWEADFEKAFKGTATNLVRTEQKFGNLLNIGL